LIDILDTYGQNQRTRKRKPVVERRGQTIEISTVYD